MEMSRHQFGGDKGMTNQWSDPLLTSSTERGML